MSCLLVIFLLAVDESECIESTVVPPKSVRVRSLSRKSRVTGKNCECSSVFLYVISILSN
jgi:hypothetical protein